MEQLQDRGPDISPQELVETKTEWMVNIGQTFAGYTETQLHMNANVAPCLIYKCETICYTIYFTMLCLLVLILSAMLS